jgi:AbrB family looped-hinge helix DNA binding protein
MKAFTSRVNSKGQVTLPREIRSRLGIEPGDNVLILLDDDGTVRLTTPRYADLAALGGAAGTLHEPLSWEQQREIAREDHLNAEYLE